MSQEESDRLVLVVDTSKITNEQRERLRELQSRPMAILPFENPSENERALADMLNSVLHNVWFLGADTIDPRHLRDMARKIQAAGIPLMGWASDLGLDPAQEKIDLAGGAGERP